MTIGQNQSPTRRQNVTRVVQGKAVCSKASALVPARARAESQPLLATRLGETGGSKVIRRSKANVARRQIERSFSEAAAFRFKRRAIQAAMACTSVDIGLNGAASWLCVSFGRWRWAQFLAQGPARDAVGRSRCRGRSDPVHRCRQPDV